MSKSKYDLYLQELLKKVKSEGILVKTMEAGIFPDFVKREEYKKDLGAVPVKNILGNITNVYVVYEDHDGSIKYYDYPSSTKKNLKGKRKSLEETNGIKIFKVSLYGNAYYFLDNLSEEEKEKCKKVAELYRADEFQKHSIEEYIDVMRVEHNIVLKKVEVSFCIGV